MAKEGSENVQEDTAIGKKSLFSITKAHHSQDRDQVEDAALLQREMSEGLPKNIEDFKGHPVYVLQRHLLRNEAIYPLNEVGKVRQASRQGMVGKVEPVYRRRDVHIVKSADKWFRLGRQVKVRGLLFLISNNLIWLVW